MRKLILICLFAFLYCCILLGQTGVGVNLGVSQYSYSPNGKNNTIGTKVENSTKLGYQLGTHYYWRHRAVLSTMIQLQWLHYQSEITASNSARFAGSRRTANFKFETFALSLMPIVRFGSLKKLFVGIGLFSNVTINNPNLEVKIREWNFFRQTSLETTVTTRQSSLIKQITAGLSASAGFNIPISPKVSIGFSASYHYGLRDIGTPAFASYISRQNRLSFGIHVDFTRYILHGGRFI